MKLEAAQSEINAALSDFDVYRSSKSAVVSEFAGIQNMRFPPRRAVSLGETVAGSTSANVQSQMIETAEDIARRITEALDKIDALEDQIRRLEEQIAACQAEIRRLEAEARARAAAAAAASKSSTSTTTKKVK